MALVTLPTTPAPSISSIVNETDISYIGVASTILAAGMPCFITTTGLISPSNSTSALAATIDGWTTAPANAGEIVSLIREATFEYSTLNANDYYYLSTSSGQLDDAPNGFSLTPVAYKVLDRQVNEASKSRIRLRGVSTY